MSSRMRPLSYISITISVILFVSKSLKADTMSITIGPVALFFYILSSVELKSNDIFQLIPYFVFYSFISFVVKKFSTIYIPALKSFLN